VTDRQREIVAAARAIIETDGVEALTMSRLGAAVGMRAPSLYKHFPDKASVEAALAAQALEDLAQAFARADDASFAGLARAYRAWAHAHPRLHRFVNARPLPRDRLPAGLEQRTAAPLIAAAGGDRDLARAAWAAIAGLVDLELNGRLPPDADVDAAYAAAVRALTLASD
jgi:AcrR family transcriptional regulator